MNNEVDSLISKSIEDKIRCDISGRAHYMSAELLEKRRNKLIIPSIILSSVVGATLFFSIMLKSNYLWLKISLGFFSLVSAVLMTLESRLQLSKSSEESRLAGVKYRAMSRRFDLFTYKYSNKLGDSKIRNQAIKQYEELMNKLDELATESPIIKDVIYEKAKKEIEVEIKAKMK